MASTIAACSSGSMPCAIAIVRLSGPEAFSVLDGVFQPKSGKPVSQRKPRAMHFGKVLAKDGMTMLVVTHEMAFARDVSNHVVFMSQGVICEEGSPEAVFGNPQKQETKDFLARFRNR